MLLELLAEHGATCDGERATSISIETASGLLPAVLLAGGYIVYAINAAGSVALSRLVFGQSRQERRWRRVRAGQRVTHRSQRSPAGAARLRAGAGVRVLARAQQHAVWDRQQTQNKLRSLPTKPRTQ